MPCAPSVEEISYAPFIGQSGFQECLFGGWIIHVHDAPYPVRLQDGEAEPVSQVQDLWRVTLVLQFPGNGEAATVDAAERPDGHPDRPGQHVAGEAGGAERIVAARPPAGLRLGLPDSLRHLPGRHGGERHIVRDDRVPPQLAQCGMVVRC